jgi:hypothetical protein
MTSLVLLPAMGIKLVIAVESLSTKATLWMTLETTLIYSSRVVISELLMLAELLLCEQFVLVREDLLIPRT